MSNTPTGEDKRFAANMNLTLSTALMGAAVAVVTFFSAIGLFVAEKRSPMFLFYFLMVAGFVLLLAGMLAGSFAISRIARSGSKGDWINPNFRWGFTLQASLSLFGIIAFAVSLMFAGPSSNDSLQTDLQTLKREEVLLRDQVDRLEKQTQALVPVDRAITDVKAGLDGARKDILRLDGAVPELVKDVKGTIRDLATTAEQLRSLSERLQRIERSLDKSKPPPSTQPH